MSADSSAPVPRGFAGGNHLRLLRTGGEYFPALLEAIDQARHEVHLETYIFADDDTGRRVVAALTRAARRGVAVRVLVDGFGARGFEDGLGATLTADGVEVLTYRPEVGRFSFRRHRLRRLHRKLAVIDGEIGFAGGINVIDDFDASIAPRFDFAVRIEGPLVARLHLAVRHVWRLVRWARLGRRPPPPLHLPPPLRPATAGAMQAALLLRDNLAHRHDIEYAYLDAIRGARDEILIANAYFLPGRRFRKTLLLAAQRGVKVSLLLQGRSDHRLFHYATQALYDRMLAAGVRVYEYDRAELHAKVAVIDEDWATVGSSNIDPFSLLLAREANVVVRDVAFAAELRASLGGLLTGAAREVRVEDQRQRPWKARLASWFAYSLLRFMLGVTRYAGRQYSG
ncbi:MAG: cardiolipin synthase ClsB [Sulfuritalea sp.]|nr:cardiolipin synthase ClsB [Sulfuritalea sp.]